MPVPGHCLLFHLLLVIKQIKIYNYAACCLVHQGSRDDVMLLQLFSCVLYSCIFLFISRCRKTLHQDNMSVQLIPPYTPVSFSKTGVYRGIHYCLIFALKHRLWVLVRTA